MKKFVYTMVIVAVVSLVLGTVGVASAQTPTQAPASAAGWMGGRGSQAGMGVGNTINGEGILHDYMIAAFAEELDIPSADPEARLDGGETMAQNALSTGLTLEQFRTLMVEVRAQVIEQALNDGVLTQAQADWMMLRGVGQMGAGRGMHGSGQGLFANPDCPYYTPTTP